MLTSILAESLATTSDNLSWAKVMFDLAEEATEDLSSEAKLRLGLVQAGLRLAIEGMECDELQDLIKQSELHCDY